MGNGAVEVHLFAAAKAAAGVPRVDVAPGTLREILDALDEAYGGFAPVRPRCSYLLDGTATHDLDIRVAAGSRIDVLPPFAGG